MIKYKIIGNKCVMQNHQQIILKDTFANILPIKNMPSIGSSTFLMTILNMVLATSPYSMPYAFMESGILLGLLIFAFSSLLAYNSAQFIVETIACVSAKNYNQNEQSDITKHSEDNEIQNSQFFIKYKLELFTLCKAFDYNGNKIVTIFSMIILVLFMLGGMLVKCISSCLSLTKALSFALYGNLDIINEKWGFDVYYLSLFIFACIATGFALGNIENSKILQIFIMGIRFCILGLMILISLYTIFSYGQLNNSIQIDSNENPDFVYADFTKISYLIGNVLFVTMLHHSVSGLIYPLRPQIKINQNFAIGFMLQFLIAVTHTILGVMAFGKYKNSCEKFPCKIQEIFNMNYQGIPFLGAFIQFFPVLGIAVFPVVAITLRNNLMQIFGISSSIVFLT